MDYLQLAGQQAIQRSANAEAITYLTTALELLQTLDTSERARQELMLQVTLGPALMATKGYAAPEVREVYTRARELAEESGEARQLFPVLWGVWQFHVNSGEHRTAYELAERLLALAGPLQDSALLVEAYYTLGITALCHGKHGVVLSHAEQGTATPKLKPTRVSRRLSRSRAASRQNH